MKYDIKALIEKNDKLEELILNTSSGGNILNSNTIQLSEDNFVTFLNNKLPLNTEESLEEFENKLVDNTFRFKVVNV